jgi:hypothetical protein
MWKDEAMEAVAEEATSILGSLSNFLISTPSLPSPLYALGFALCQFTARKKKDEGKKE